jgi:hypothetical protein
MKEKVNTNMRSGDLPQEVTDTRILSFWATFQMFLK